MIKISADKNHVSLDVSGSIKDLTLDVITIIHTMRNNEVLGFIYPVAEFFEKEHKEVLNKNAKNDISD